MKAECNMCGCTTDVFQVIDLGAGAEFTLCEDCCIRVEETILDYRDRMERFDHSAFEEDI